MVTFKQNQRKLRPESTELICNLYNHQKDGTTHQSAQSQLSVRHNMSLDTGRLVSSLAATLSLPLTHLACSNKIPLYLFYIHHAEHCRYTHQATQSHAV